MTKYIRTFHNPLVILYYETIYRENNNGHSFTIVSKKIKYLLINLTKEVNEYTLKTLNL